MIPCCGNVIYNRDVTINLNYMTLGTSLEESGTLYRVKMTSLGSVTGL